MPALNQEQCEWNQEPFLGCYEYLLMDGNPRLMMVNGSDQASTIDPVRHSKDVALIIYAVISLRVPGYFLRDSSLSKDMGIVPYMGDYDLLQ